MDGEISTPVGHVCKPILLYICVDAINMAHSRVHMVSTSCVPFNVAALEGTGPGVPVLLKGTGAGYLLTIAPHKHKLSLPSQTWCRVRLVVHPSSPRTI